MVKLIQQYIIIKNLFKIKIFRLLRVIFCSTVIIVPTYMVKIMINTSNKLKYKLSQKSILNSGRIYVSMMNFVFQALSNNRNPIFKVKSCDELVQVFKKEYKFLIKGYTDIFRP